LMLDYVWSGTSPAALQQRHPLTGQAHRQRQGAELLVSRVRWEEHLGDVVVGYGTDVDLDVIRGWWSSRSPLVVRWLVEHGFDPFVPGCEVDVLRSRM
jgi:hypothetical protein